MNIRKVIEHLGKEQTSRSHPFGLCDQYWATWQCSHIRYVRATWDAADFSAEETLAWIILREQSIYVDEWLASFDTTSIIATSSKREVEYMRSLEKEVRSSDFLTKDETFKFPWLDKVPDQLYSIQGMHLYPYGPSSVFAWKHEHSLYYFEVHHES